MGFFRLDTIVGCHFLLQGIFPPRDGSCLSSISHIGTREFFTTSTAWEALKPKVVGPPSVFPLN